MVWLSIIAAVFCIIQVSILYTIAIFQVTPNIVLAIVIYSALVYPRAGIWIGFATGLFLDFYSPTLGYNALIGTIIGYGIGILSSKIYKDLLILWIIILFVCSLLNDIVIFISKHELYLYFFFRYILTGAIYTTVIGLIMFYLLKKSRL
jgi:rod shape-determining protein MreD